MAIWWGLLWTLLLIKVITAVMPTAWLRGLQVGFTAVSFVVLMALAGNPDTRWVAVVCLGLWLGFWLLGRKETP